MNGFVILFSVSFFMVFHAYIGYPLSLLLIGIFRRQKCVRRRITPRLTLIITVCNEEKKITAKLKNTLELNYPREQLQILVASDGSTDATNDIVRSYSARGIELLALPHRGGKENAQKAAVSYAGGDILVFSDVATILEPRGLMEIVSNFADPSVGCVSSEDRMIGEDGRPSGEGAYLRYEMWLRRLESRVNSLVGLSGSFFAARKEVCRDFSGEVQSDFRTLLNSMKLGLRGVSDPEATGSYVNLSDEKREFERKTRTVLRGLTVFFRHTGFLNVFRYGLFSYQFFCHKLLRWLVPFFLMGALGANVMAALSSPLFVLVLGGQIFFYSIGIYGWTGHSLTGIWKIPMFFLVVNVAITVAWKQYLSGKRMVLWEPSAR